MTRLGRWIQVIGCLFVFAGFGSFVFLHVFSSKAAENNAHMVQTIEHILPERSSGMKDSYRNMEMPVFQMEEQDIIALIEIPSYQLQLPVAAQWNSWETLSMPCRLEGTAYDGSLVIGGTDQKGQFDCFDELSEGCEVILTDMNGSQFNYSVRRIDRAKSAEKARLADEEYDLILFARDNFSLNYLIVKCKNGDFR